jgi:hypothetical protein
MKCNDFDLFSIVSDLRARYLWYVADNEAQTDALIMGIQLIHVVLIA